MNKNYKCLEIEAFVSMRAFVCLCALVVYVYIYMDESQKFYRLAR